MRTAVAVQHGTWQCYRRSKCQRPVCLAAWSRYVKRNNHRRLTVGLATVPITGTRRRLQALSAMGYSRSVLARLLGLDEASLRQLAGLKTQSTRRVMRRTEARVKRLYDEISMVPPPPSGAVTQARDRARAKGWAPPLAWDDDTIEDPKAKPQGVTVVGGDYCGAGKHFKTAQNAYHPPNRLGVRQCADCRHEASLRRNRSLKASGKEGKASRLAA